MECLDREPPIVGDGAACRRERPPAPRLTSAVAVVLPVGCGRALRRTSSAVSTTNQRRTAQPTARDGEKKPLGRLKQLPYGRKRTQLSQHASATSPHEDSRENGRRLSGALWKDGGVRHPAHGLDRGASFRMPPGAGLGRSGPGQRCRPRRASTSRNRLAVPASVDAPTHRHSGPSPR